MLDPREQKKGGFGAFVARERERVTGPETPATAAPDPTVDADATGTSAAAPTPEPRRPRLFRSIL